MKIIVRNVFLKFTDGFTMQFSNNKKLFLFMDVEML